MDLNESNSEVGLSKQSLIYLNETRKWTNFLSIVGFVGIGFMVLAGLFAGSLLSNLPNAEQLPSGFFGFFYVIIAALYFFPIYYLFKFSSNMKMGIQLRNEAHIEEAFSNLKSHYKFMGILMAVILIFYALIFVGSMFFAALF